MYEYHVYMKEIILKFQLHFSNKFLSTFDLKLCSLGFQHRGAVYAWMQMDSMSVVTGVIVTSKSVPLHQKMGAESGKQVA
jgi:hypothetical protein